MVIIIITGTSKGGATRLQPTPPSEIYKMQI